MTLSLPSLDDPKNEALRLAAVTYIDAKDELAKETKKLRQEMTDAEAEVTSLMEKAGKQHYFNSELGVSIDISKPKEKVKVSIHVFPPVKPLGKD